MFCEETSGGLTVKLRNPSEPRRLQHFLTLSYGTLNPCSFVKLWIALKDTPCKVQVSFFFLWLETISGPVWKKGTDAGILISTATTVAFMFYMSRDSTMSITWCVWLSIWRNHQAKHWFLEQYGRCHSMLKHAQSVQDIMVSWSKVTCLAFLCLCPSDGMMFSDCLSVPFLWLWFLRRSLGERDPLG